MRKKIAIVSLIVVLSLLLLDFYTSYRRTQVSLYAQSIFMNNLVVDAISNKNEKLYDTCSIQLSIYKSSLDPMISRLGYEYVSTLEYIVNEYTLEELYEKNVHNRLIIHYQGMKTSFIPSIKFGDKMNGVIEYLKSIDG